MQRGTEREARERKTKKDKDRKQLATDVIHSHLLPTGKSSDANSIPTETQSPSWHEHTGLLCLSKGILSSFGSY